MGLVGIGSFPPEGSLLDKWTDWIAYRGLEQPPVWVPKAPQTPQEMTSWSPDRMVKISWEGYQGDLKKFFEEQDKRNKGSSVDNSKVVLVILAVVLLVILLKR